MAAKQWLHMAVESAKTVTQGSSGRQAPTDRTAAREAQEAYGVAHANVRRQLMVLKDREVRPQPMLPECSAAPQQPMLPEDNAASRQLMVPAVSAAPQQLMLPEDNGASRQLVVPAEVSKTCLACAGRHRPHTCGKLVKAMPAHNQVKAIEIAPPTLEADSARRVPTDRTAARQAQEVQEVSQREAASVRATQRRAEQAALALTDLQSQEELLHGAAHLLVHVVHGPSAF